MTKTLTLQLLDHEGTNPISVEVEQDKLLDAGIVTHKGNWYTFKGLGGRFFVGATFQQVNPPVEIP